MLMNGFDGQTITARNSGSARALRKSGCGWAVSLPANSRLRTAGAQRRRTK